MYKILILTVVLLSGCSNIKITGTMCDDIHLKPGEAMPKECIAYNKKKADAAFNKKKNEKITSDKDVIKFTKDKNDN